MLLPVTLVALSALAQVDAPAMPGARCERCVLVAQDLSAPPLPGTSVPSPSFSGTDAELRLRIDDLNREIRSIDVNWPPGYIVLAYAGYVCAPSGLALGAAFLVMGAVFASAGGQLAGLGAALLAIGAGGVLIGLVGVAAIVFAWVNGEAVVRENRARRDELVKERAALEDELRRRKVGMPAPRSPELPAPQLFTLATF